MCTCSCKEAAGASYTQQKQQIRALQSDGRSGFYSWGAAETEPLTSAPRIWVVTNNPDLARSHKHGAKLCEQMECWQSKSPSVLTHIAQSACSLYSNTGLHGSTLPTQAKIVCFSVRQETSNAAGYDSHAMIAMSAILAGDVFASLVDRAAKQWVFSSLHLLSCVEILPSVVW